MPLNRTPFELRMELMEELGSPRGPDDQYTAALVSQGAGLNFDSERKHSPLLRSAYMGADLTIAAIIKRGADINQQDCDGWTALMWAANRGNHKTVKILCDAGADMHLFGKNGETAFSLAETPARQQPRMDRHDMTMQELVYAQKALNVKQAQAEAEAAIMAGQNAVAAIESGAAAPIKVMRPLQLRKGFTP
jgi:hypothetical protein